MFFCGISKPNQTKLNQSKPKTLYFVCLSKPIIQTKPNQTFSTINSKLTSSKKLNQKYLKSLLELRNSCTDLYLLFSAKRRSNIKQQTTRKGKFSFLWSFYIWKGTQILCNSCENDGLTWKINLIWFKVEFRLCNIRTAGWSVCWNSVFIWFRVEISLGDWDSV